MNVIETSELGKRYGKTWALRDCTLAVPAGHLAALVGPNGAGKSTLMNMTVGLTVPTAGTATVLGGRPAGSPGRARRRRVRRAGRAGLQEPVRRGHAAPDREPEPALRLAIRAGAAGRPRHPAEEEGGQALRRPAVAARAHPGAGQAAAAAHPGRAAGRARPHRAAGLPGRGDDRDGRRRSLGAALLAPGGRARAGGRLSSSCSPAPSSRWPARSTTCWPATGC